MSVPAREQARRPWSDNDKEDLIGYWDSIGSVVLISILLDRPEGSVQTEASRLNLPRRSEERGRHRKKWTEDEFGGLLETVEACRSRDGDKIRIVEVANKVGRSIDAVISRLTEHYGSREELKQRILVSDAEIFAFKARGAAQKAASQPSPEADAPRRDTRGMAMMRKCLTCSKPFWSTSAANRICPKCRCSDTSDWD